MSETPPGGDARGGHGTPHAHDPRQPLANQSFWDERYRTRDALWSAQPNSQLVSETSDLAPGEALDVGCGEGADAIWLAERGWRVTAVDFSAVALERGAARAIVAGAEVAQRIDWRHEDLTKWAPPATFYDLVSAQFMHLPKDQREPLFSRLAASVAPGGCLLIVGHHPSDLQTSVPRPRMPDFLYTASDVADALDPRSWEVIVSAARERTSIDPGGNTVIIHDAVLRAQRRK